MKAGQQAEANATASEAQESTESYFGRSELNFLLAVTFVLFILNALYFLRPAREAVAEFYERDFPSGWATLLGAVIGFSAIAWQTRTGFKNLIRSQENAAELDRKALAEKARVDREAQLHKADIDRVAKHEDEIRHRRTLCAALIGELSSVHDKLWNSHQWLRVQEVILEELVRTDRNAKTRFAMQFIPTPVYEANISNLGFLGASIAGDVVAVYSASSVKIERTDEPSPAVMWVPIARGLREAIPDITKDVLHVVTRLSALSSGGDDPGPLFYARKARNDASNSVAKTQ